MMRIPSPGLTWVRFFIVCYSVNLTLISEKGQNKVNFTLPEALPSGQYLVRVESIGLHEAQTAGGAQFYLSCGQIEVTGGGNGIPEPLVAFPGAYQPTDPGILIDIWNPSVSSDHWLALW